MAISPISELSNMYAGVSKKSDSEAKVDGKIEFQSYMQDATTKNDSKDPYMDNLPVASNKMKADTSKSADTKETSTVDNSEKVNKNSDSLSTDHKDVKKVDEGATKELKDKIIDEAAKELGVSEEDIVEVLSQLGIGAADLLNTENVSLLVANVAGDGDVLGILTDENAAGMVLELNANIEDILNVEAKAQDVSPDLLKDIAINSVETVEAVETAMEADVLPTDELDAPVTETENIEVSHEVVPVSNSQESTKAEDNSGQTSSDSGQDTGSRLDHRDDHESIAQNVINSANQGPDNNIQVTDVDNTMVASESSQVDTIDIINQIQEHVRVEFKEDMTQLQMQLNPENLGTVNLTIAAKEGNVTAQLMTQNEAVQAALESQIAMLKESLEQQGVKVEAIEVTVASHSFEQNLEQGNDFNDQQEEVNERLRKATRKLDINGIMTDEEIDELDEAEQVTARMMQADGNSMDYRV